MDKIIITSEPVITGNKIYSKETSDNKAMRGFAAAGGWTLLKYIIKEIDKPTESPNVRKETPKILLNIIPVIMQIKWPKKIFEGCAMRLLNIVNVINTDGPNEIINQIPVDVS